MSLIRNRTKPANQLATDFAPNTLGTDPDPKLESPLVNVSMNETPTPHETPTDPIKIPSKYLNGYNLNSHLNDYAHRRKMLKNSKAKGLLQNGIKDILEVYNPDEDKYNIQLVKDLMNIVEFFMVHDSKLGPDKKEIVLSCALLFFDGNDQLLSSIIEHLMLELKQNRFLGRIMSKLYIFFCSPNQ